MIFVSQRYLAALSPEARTRLLETHLPVGVHPDTHDRALIPERDRYSGMYILGVQGMGKSGLLETLISHDVAIRNAVIVIDPHGDLTKNCLAALPSSRVKQAYLLDLEDEAHPFGINVFSTGQEITTEIGRTRVVERIMHVFETLWPDVLSQQHLPRYVRAATLVFLDNPGSTLVDMHTFLINADFRAKLLRNVTDPTVRQFWQTQYEELSERERNTRVSALVGRLETLFMGRSLVRNILGQRQPTLNFRQMIERRELVFIKLPVKTAPEVAKLVGTIIVAQLHAAIFSFSDLPEEQRPGLSLFVDEFEWYTTSDFAELFTEGRKFGARVTVAHQFRGQLPAYLQQASMTARTKVVFHTTPEDAREMAFLFPSAGRPMQLEDLTANPVDYLASYGSSNPAVQTFIPHSARTIGAFFAFSTKPWKYGHFC